jgi:hypothetical protein
MKKLLCLIAIISVFAACSSYGDKYQVNEKSEVYYKDGMTAEDAKKLGDFLMKNGYFDSTNEKSVQLLKEKDTIAVKFVVDKAKVAETESADALFMIMGSAISSEIFSGKPLKIILADAYMKGFKDVAIPGSASSDSTR